MRKKKVVLSGVNMTEGGILTIFRNFVQYLSKKPNLEIICLVNSKKLFEDIPGLETVTFYDFPDIKKSWFKRICFEYYTSYNLSKKLNPDFWFCLHDISARVSLSVNQYVYCHNPTPFYNPKLSDFKFDKKFYLFCYLYKFLYKINITSNKAIIVQQSWIAKYFKSHFSVDNIYVSRPLPKLSNETKNDDSSKNQLIYGKKSSECINIYYPSVPRIFKNFEVIISALKNLKDNDPVSYGRLIIYFTFSKGHSIFGDHIIEMVEKEGIENIKFIGFQSYTQMERIYKKEADVILFPSKLETWGLPLSEAASFNLPILSADLPYARETLADYYNVKFFEPNDSLGLSSIFSMLSTGKSIKLCHKSISKDNEFPIFNSYEQLLDEVFND